MRVPICWPSTTPTESRWAVANVSTQAAIISVIIRDDTGAVIGLGASIFALGLTGTPPSYYPTRIWGSRLRLTNEGLSSSIRRMGGRISVLGLRFTPPNNALTTIPALANVGTGGGSIAHLASGGDGWQTTFVLVNTGTSAASIILNFFADQTGVPLSSPLSFPQPDGGAATVASSFTQTLAAERLGDREQRTENLPLDRRNSRRPGTSAGL